MRLGMPGVKFVQQLHLLLEPGFVLLFLPGPPVWISLAGASATRAAEMTWRARRGTFALGVVFGLAGMAEVEAHGAGLEVLGEGHVETRCGGAEGQPVERCLPGRDQPQPVEKACHKRAGVDGQA